MKKQKPYWYLSHVGECPVCGKDKSYRERMNTEKPKEKKDCFVSIPYAEAYDWCDVGV